MKFDVSGSLLYKKLLAVSKAISPINVERCYDRVYFKVEGDLLKVSGFNSDGFACTASMKIAGNPADGEFSIQAKGLPGIISRIADCTLTFVVADDFKSVEIRYPDGCFRFTGVDWHDAPSVSEPGDDAKTMVLPGAVVLKGVENTLYAVGYESIRPILNSIYWDFHEADVTFVGTEMHKLSRYINREVAPGMETSFMMPPRVAYMLMSIVRENDSDVRLTFDSKCGMFEVGDYLLSCSFIQGKYPPYSKVFPKGLPNVLRAERKELLSVLGRVNVLYKVIVPLVFGLSHEKVSLSIGDPDAENSVEEYLPCVYEGEDARIGFDGQFMLQSINVLKEGTVVIEFPGSESAPCMIHPLDQEEGGELTLLLMPREI